MTSRPVNLRSPDGWRVSQVTLVVGGQREAVLRVTNPHGTVIGNYDTPAEVMRVLTDRGVDPVTLVDDISTNTEAKE
jgi:hypothetical protein